MNKQTLSLLVVVGIILVQSFTSAAQTSTPVAINSKDDYAKIKSSIASLSQKLYHYSQQYPGYTFSTEYGATGKVLQVQVSGVADDEMARQISRCHLELENLGEIIRRMNGAYLPTEKTNTQESKLTESEAKKYVPDFGR